MVAGSPFKPADTSGFYYASGGAATPVSGTMSDPSLSGAWMIEHQDLEIDYVRVPNMFVSSINCDLDSGSINHRVGSTELVLAVKAHYRKRKTYGSYSTSSYQQPQKFQINAVSADHKGNTYGDLSGGASGTAMGPAGTIVTYQPWMQRRRWDDSIDTEASKFMNMGYNFYVRLGTCEQGVALPGLNSHHMTDFEGHAIPGTAAGKFVTSQFLAYTGAPVTNTLWHDHYIPGSYSTDKETTAAIFQMIDHVGSRITGSTFLPEVTVETPIADMNNNRVGFAEYNNSRHDYS